MRCSYFKPRLDAYVDGDLEPRERALIAVHVGSCPECAGLLEELRVIDALLLGPRRLEPAANFTYKVMADVRALPQPHVHRIPTLPVLVTYIVFAWATIGAFLWWGGSTARAMLAMLGASARQFGFAAGVLTTSAGHLFGAQTPEVTRAMGAILGGDVLLAGAVAGLYALRRARRNAQRASEPS
ncbi:MAG: zf-HC2 domain-containing protein [Candidatus Eremiobacteraeota bacterium]|nr:zf-HC2 domain-containing protein [Candidatus Eremiobacteraeota bacterium]MBC5802396.1 zf-HC2 domain-containing protein [Candidatus Eremiobacteraeota bacterium]MBC5820614.1 zf-HC2 domain-containing protein [Candidatus Eremiobacteraeota bacterium]